MRTYRKLKDLEWQPAKAVDRASDLPISSPETDPADVAVMSEDFKALKSKVGAYALKFIMEASGLSGSEQGEGGVEGGKREQAIGKDDVEGTGERWEGGILHVIMNPSRARTTSPANSFTLIAEFRPSELLDFYKHRGLHPLIDLLEDSLDRSCDLHLDSTTSKLERAQVENLEHELESLEAKMYALWTETKWEELGKDTNARELGEAFLKALVGFRRRGGKLKLDWFLDEKLDQEEEKLKTKTV
ncbi:MAG: hypothetical protein Q9221_008951 [Calogaya cf. arnoldii]